VVGTAASEVLPLPAGPAGLLSTEVPSEVLATTHTEAASSAPAPEAESKARNRRRDRFGADVAAAARHYLNHKTTGFRSDCSGFAMAVFARVGVPIDGSTSSLWADLKAEGATHTRKEPRVGDLAFFDNTTDRNRNGRLDDGLTHIAVVISVEEDGTILMAHDGTGAGRAELYMNLHHPDVHISDRGKVLNNHLRGRRKGDRKGTKYMAGELWHGFATVDPKMDIAGL
jgi:surface antigen